MNRSNSPYRARTLARACVLALALTGLAGSPRTAAAQSVKGEIPRASFNHEELPEAVSGYSLRRSGLGTRIDGAAKGEFAPLVEARVTDVGLHIRSERFLETRRSALMFQSVAGKSTDGPSGMAPIIEFEVPTRSDGGKPTTPVGFTSKLALGEVPQPAPMKMDSATTTQPAMATAGQMTEEIPHPFFTHMGMPEAVGTYSLRTAALATNGVAGNTKGDFAFHFETGLSENVGLHIRNDRFLMNKSTEIMFQFPVIRSKNGMNGVSTLIEFEVPTNTSQKRINTLVGFSSALGNSTVAFNQVLHYNPRLDMLDGSVALVFKASRKVFLVAEMLGTRMPGGKVILNPLVGVKIRVNKNVVLGLGYMRPITTNKDFSSQYIFQPDFGW